MGRPRTFDLEQAIGIATELFWLKGYDGTSVSDLTEAMHITPPSFYFAFHSKEELFRRIVGTYRERQARLIADAMAQPTAKAVIEQLLTGFAAFFLSGGQAKGCLVMNSALPVVEDHPLRQEFAAERQSFQRELSACLSARGDIPAGLDADGLSRMVAALIWGLAVEAQSGATADELAAIAPTLLAMWPAGAPSRKVN